MTQNNYTSLPPPSLSTLKVREINVFEYRKLSL